MKDLLQKEMNDDDFKSLICRKMRWHYDYKEFSVRICVISWWLNEQRSSRKAQRAQFLHVLQFKCVLYKASLDKEALILSLIAPLIFLSENCALICSSWQRAQPSYPMIQFHQSIYIFFSKFLCYCISVLMRLFLLYLLLRWFLQIYKAQRNVILCAAACLLYWY